MKKILVPLFLLFVGWVGGIATATIADSMVTNQMERIKAASMAYKKD